MDGKTLVAGKEKKKETTAEGRENHRPAQKAALLRACPARVPHLHAMCGAKRVDLAAMVTPSGGQSHSPSQCFASVDSCQARGFSR